MEKVGEQKNDRTAVEHVVQEGEGGGYVVAGRAAGRRAAPG
jgi:hypothetical protein